jgi:DNA repair protein RadC
MKKRSLQSIPDLSIIESGQSLKVNDEIVNFIKITDSGNVTVQTGEGRRSYHPKNVFLADGTADSNIEGFVNCISIQYEANKEIPSVCVRSPDDANKLARSFWNSMMPIKESFYAIFLDNSKNVVGYYLVSIGTATCSLADPADIFRTAMLANAQSIIVCHNHPSGVMEPSPADISLTKRLDKIGKLLGIDLDDHIILTPSGDYVSLRRRGDL